MVEDYSDDGTLVLMVIVSKDQHKAISQFLDTAFSNHMTDQKNLLVKFDNTRKRNDRISAIFEDVLFVKGMRRNLLSVDQLIEKGPQNMVLGFLTFTMLDKMCDGCLMCMCVKQQQAYMLVYMNELLVTRSNKYGIKKFKELMMSEFEMIDSSMLFYFLGMEFLKTSRGLMLQQRNYEGEILKSLKMK